MAFGGKVSLALVKFAKVILVEPSFRAKNGNWSFNVRSQDQFPFLRIHAVQSKGKVIDFLIHCLALSF